MLRRRTTILLCALTGVALELGVHALSGRREAWDSMQFWLLGLPLAVGVSAIVGFLSAQSDWIWTLVIAPSQVMTMMVGTGEIGGLWPVTIVFSTILSTPFVIAAFVGSRFRRKAKER